MWQVWSLNLVFMLRLNTSDCRVALRTGEAERLFIEQEMLQEWHIVFIETFVTDHDSKVEVPLIKT